MVTTALSQGAVVSKVNATVNKRTKKALSVVIYVWSLMFLER